MYRNLCRIIRVNILNKKMVIEIMLVLVNKFLVNVYIFMLM